MARTAVAYLLPQDRFEDDVLPDRLVVAQTVIEPDAAGRSGLAAALEAIARGQADALVVARLGAAAGSLGELMRLVDWLGDHRASLIALDVQLDTAARSGQHTLAVLREVHRWAREPEQPRRPPGRPGLSALAPDLARRIAKLREEGLSLHAIADRLNAEGVPTPRGGASWRASSVQAALGYRRPRPPVPGAAPPPGPPHGGEAPPAKSPRHREETPAKSPRRHETKPPEGRGKPPRPPGRRAARHRARRPKP